MMTHAAKLQFDAFDVDGSGGIRGKELGEMAKWIWKSFRPDQEMDFAALKEEVGRLLEEVGSPLAPKMQARRIGWH